MPNGTEFFSNTAPEGDRVAILYNRLRRGDGEYGYTQVLTDSLQADTLYTLTVEVGNIASGTDINGTFYNQYNFLNHSLFANIRIHTFLLYGKL